MIVLSPEYDIGFTPVSRTRLLRFYALSAGGQLLVTLSPVSLVPGKDDAGRGNVAYLDPSLTAVMASSAGPCIYHGGPDRLLRLPCHVLGLGL